MKTLLVCIAVTVISCTTNDEKKATNLGSDLNRASTISAVNDTFCYSNTQNFKDIKVKLISACHVVLSDSISNTFHGLYGAGKLPKEYNFDNHLSFNLYYEKAKDTLMLKLLYLVRNRNYRILPDTFYSKADTLFIRQKGELIADSSDFQLFKFEEFNYTFNY